MCKICANNYICIMQNANRNFTFRLYLDTRYINSSDEYLGKFEIKSILISLGLNH